MHLQMIITEGEKLYRVGISGPWCNLGSPPNQPMPLRISAIPWTVTLPILLPRGPSPPHSFCERFPENFCMAPVWMVCFWEMPLPENRALGNFQSGVKGPPQGKALLRLPVGFLRALSTTLAY